MMDQEEIQKLIKSGKKEEKKIFAIVVAEFQPLVFRVAFRLLCDENEAKDAVQETFIKAWLSLERYDPTYKFSTWLYKIACNTCYDRLRSFRRFSAEPGAFSSEAAHIPSDDDMEASFSNRQLKELILRYTGELPPQQRQIFILRDVEELDVPEVQAITGLSPERIKSNLYLARKNIRKKMNKIDPE